MRQQLGAIFVAGGLVLTTACGGAATAASAPRAEKTAPAVTSVAGAQQVTIEVGNSMSFTPSTLTVRAGQPVELVLRNGGNIPHDFTLAEGVPEAVTVKAGGGETARATFTIERPGTYTFVCSVAGHEQAGMVGTITAQ